MATQEEKDLETQFLEGAIKAPGDWKTGNDPATAPMLSHLDTLRNASDRNDEIAAEMTRGGMSKARASELISELREEQGLDTQG